MIGYQSSIEKPQLRVGKDLNEFGRVSVLRIRALPQFPRDVSGRHKCGADREVVEEVNIISCIQAESHAIDGIRGRAAGGNPVERVA